MPDKVNWRSQDVLDFYAHKFDFSNQHKFTYNDWIKAYREAVRRRAEDGCFMGLSSGYDSGALYKELNNIGTEYTAYAIYNNENKEVLDKRIAEVKNVAIAVFSKKDFQRLYNYLSDKIPNENMYDCASPGVAYMFENAVRDGRKVCLVNQGADEIISDYSLYPFQSTFKGTYPEKLEEWKNFKEGKNREYINQLESIANLYGVELRYPFLDINLVQEFLWLSPELKNRNYKAPLYEYLKMENVPFEEGKKRGFNPINISKQREWYNNWIRTNNLGKVLDVGKSLDWDYGFTTIDNDASRNPTIVGNIEKTGFQDNEFDTVLCFGMYEYVDDTQKMIEEIYRIVKPGGTVLFGFTGLDYPFHGRTGKKFEDPNELSKFSVVKRIDFNREYHVFICKKPYGN